MKQLSEYEQALRDGIPPEGATAAQKNAFHALLGWLDNGGQKLITKNFSFEGDWLQVGQMLHAAQLANKHLKFSGNSGEQPNRMQLTSTVGFFRIEFHQ